MTAPKDAVPPRRWVLGLWALSRGFWTIVLPALFSAGQLSAAVFAFRCGRLVAGLVSAAFGCAAFGVAWLAAAHIRSVLLGESSEAESSMLAEVNATAALSVVGLVLLAITAPAYSGLFRYSAEGNMKGNLAGLREAVARYRGAHDGRSPESLDALAGSQALPRIPELWPLFSKSTHPATNAVTVVAGREPSDSGKWAYVVSPSSPSLNGTVFIDCTHTDARGSAWTAY